MTDQPSSEPPPRAAVIGAGPAGLMAAEAMAAAGLAVTIYDAKPSVGRKFLMAGKSGLNLTKVEAEADFRAAYAEAEPRLVAILKAFDPDAVQDWARSLGQEVFTGTTGRVFPIAMKASPLLRAWLSSLAAQGVQVKTRWRWTGWDGSALHFDTPEGSQSVAPLVTVFAMGGASWARLGATGNWLAALHAKGVAVSPFKAANVGVEVAWSAHMARHFGAALKSIGLRSGPYASRGEATISARGLEGSGIYSVSRGVREGHELIVDLLSDLSLDEVTSRLSKPRGKSSLANHLRKTLKLDGAKAALLQEMARPLPDAPSPLAQTLKALTIRHAGLRPMDEAISTAGGVAFSALDEGLMIRALPGVFVAGEMIDWEAPTGGYLITACLATGRWAGKHAAAWVI